MCKFLYDKIAEDCNLINVWVTDQILHDESQHFRQNVHVDVKAINESKLLNYKHLNFAFLFLNWHFNFNLNFF
jgi:hypothetical protein